MSLWGRKKVLKSLDHWGFPIKQTVQYVNARLLQMYEKDVSAVQIAGMAQRLWAGKPERGWGSGSG